MDFEFWYQIWCRMEEKLEFVVEIWNEIRDLEMKLGIWYKIVRFGSHTHATYMPTLIQISREKIWRRSKLHILNNPKTFCWSKLRYYKKYIKTSYVHCTGNQDKSQSSYNLKKFDENPN